MDKFITVLLLMVCVFLIACSNYSDRNGNSNVEASRPDLLYMGQLVILQAYGSSSDAAGATHSFVELFNNTDRPINLSGITLFHADGIRGVEAREAGVDRDWRSIPLQGSIPARTSFLILGDRENITGRLQIADNSGDINDPDFSLSNRSFKVALIRTNARTLDVQNPFTGDGSGMVGGFIDLLGAANNIDHATNPDNIFGYKTEPARNSASEAVRRITLNGTNNNNADFESIRYAAGGISQDELEHFRPKNRAFGAWDPISGELTGQSRGRASGTLPVVFIDTYGAEIHHSSTGIWTRMTFSLHDPNNPQNNISQISNQEIRGRGNATWVWSDKRPYRIRFRNDTSLFGQAARRNWILLAEFRDPTFLMNAVTFHLGREVFDLPYTNTFQHVHLYLNGEYWGVYLLTEHRQADPNEIGAPGRAKICPVNGWFVEFCSDFADEPKFRDRNFGLPIQINSSNVPNIQVEEDWNRLTDLMVDENFPENEWRGLINVRSFIDFIMVQKIVRNPEFLWFRSTFSFKGIGGKINMGPLWDFDFAFSNTGYDFHFNFTPPFQSHKFFNYYTGFIRPTNFYNRFFYCPAFVAQYRERWNEKFPQILAVTDWIEQTGAEIRVGVAQDFKRWQIYYWADYDSDHARQTRKMATWWRNRVNWLNRELNR